MHYVPYSPDDLRSLTDKCCRYRLTYSIIPPAFITLYQTQPVRFAFSDHIVLSTLFNAPYLVPGLVVRI